MPNRFDLKLLYVEDDKNLSEQYKIFFERRCKKLYLAYNGIEGLELFKKHSPDIIITDIRMPQMDGLEMIRKIREINREVPIIITSAFNEQEYLFKAINRGVTRYVLKPFNRTLLKQAIDETIDYVNYLKDRRIHEKELEAIFNTTKDGIAILSLDLKLITFNSSFEILADLDKNSLLNKDFLDFIKESGKTKIKELLENDIQNSSIDNLEINFLDKNKKNLYVNFSAVLMPKRKNILITLKDITKLKKYEREMKEYLKLIDENIIISTTDLDGNIIYASKAFQKISGYTLEELLGKNHNILYHKDTPKSFYTQLWETIKQDKQWKGEMKNIAKGGNIYWVNSTITPVFQDGVKIGYTSIRQDITDKKTLEEISIKDQLTNMYNRRYYEEKVVEFLNIAKRKNDKVCFVMLDVDFFKLYNDNYGHQEGDKVLISIASVLKSNMKRGNDYCFRIGGEEFVILFDTDTIENALNFSNKIRKDIEALKIEHKYNKVSDYITVSMGLYCDDSQNIKNPEILYKNADDLLYKAKESGKNKVAYNT